MAAVNEYRELNAPRPAKADQRINGGANGAARGEHVIDKHHDLVGQVIGQLRGAQLTHAALREIITV